MQFRTRAIHVGHHADPHTGAVVPPIHLASTFVQPGAGEWGPYNYARSGNPTRNAVEEVVASLEGCGPGTDHPEGGALAFASGMAAIHGVTSSLKAGDHVLAGSDLYGGAYRLFHKVMNRAGVEVSLADATDLTAFEKGFRPNTRLVWVESPGNPRMSIVDLAAVAELAHKHGALAACDNTFATPVLTRPLELGLDIVMHSATKYYGGHSDLMGGLLAARDKAVYEDLKFIQNATGGIMDPLSCFLCSRGVKTLELRVREQCRSAQRLAEWLDQHPAIGRVLYAGLPAHPGHAIAKRQMQGGFGAMITFELSAGFEAGKRLCKATRLFQLAVSLGAVESLIEQPASMSHASYDAADRAKHGITDGMIRLSVGLEAYDDLQADLEQAIAAATR
ncbi:trans-sulfuration enzyme family protein [Botrimarina hoheduenensis]|uniref:Cystathionine beta-lyase n=1 Tax=Botrimarina hoheduenensis TaxID=2528000 RepID=A0A5C5WCS1_9BACT|nr:PLP-dependent aspartate aminotransferase family protein [Botrimarina hoheduenensis]TWT48706.1 Cystathionine beta-lyase [Botrimarina hoheduenensis]